MAFSWEEVKQSDRYKNASEQGREQMRVAFVDQVVLPAARRDPKMSAIDETTIRDKWMSMHPPEFDPVGVPSPTFGERAGATGRAFARGPLMALAMVGDVAYEGSPLQEMEAGMARQRAELTGEQYVQPAQRDWMGAVQRGPLGVTREEAAQRQQYPGYDIVLRGAEELGAEVATTAAVLAAPQTAPAVAPSIGRRIVGQMQREFRKRPIRYMAEETAAAFAAGAAGHYTEGEGTLTQLATPLAAAMTIGVTTRRVNDTLNRIRPGGERPPKMTKAEKLGAALFERASAGRQVDFEAEEVAARVAVLNELGVPEDMIDTATLLNNERLNSVVQQARMANPELDRRLIQMEEEYQRTAREVLIPEGAPEETLELAQTQRAAQTAQMESEAQAAFEALGVGITQEDLGRLVRRSLVEGEGPAAKKAAKEIYAGLDDAQKATVSLESVEKVVEGLQERFTKTQYERLEPSAVATVRGKAMGGSVPLRELEGMRQILKSESRALGRGTGAEGAGQKRIMLGALIGELDRIEAEAVAAGTFSPGVATRLEEAKGLYAQYATEMGFKQRGSVPELATRMAFGDFAIDEARLASNVIRPNTPSTKGVADYLRGLGTNRAEGVENIKRYLVGQLALESGGDVPNTAQIARFKKKFRSVLAMDEFSDFNAQITGLENAKRQIDQYGFSGVEHMRRIEQAALDKVTGGESPQAIAADILRGKDPSGKVDSYLRIIGEAKDVDPTQARNALRSALFDEIWGGGARITPTGEARRLPHENILSAVERGSDSRKALSKVFSQDELRRWEEAANIQRAMEKPYRAGLKFDPKEEEAWIDIAKGTGFGRVIYWTSARRLPLMMAGEAFVTGADRVLSRLNQQEAMKVFSVMMTDPKYARDLRKKWKAQPPQKQMMMVNELLTTALGVSRTVELMQDEEY
jgi:hypothetical protein